MDFHQIAREFKQLKVRYDTGSLSEADFRARLQDLMLQDEQGRWWMIGYETGQWYVHDGEKWLRAEPSIPQKKLAEEPAHRETTAPKLTRSEVVAPPPARKWPMGWFVAAVSLVTLITTWAVMQPGPTPATPAPTMVSTLTATSRPEPTKAPATAAPTKTLEPTNLPVLGIGSTLVSPRNGMTLVYVPPGEFLMGSADGDNDANDNEKPQHRVHLDAFWMDRTEVTNAQYRQCVEAKACQSPSNTRSVADSSYYGNGQYDTYPVIYVSWYAAQEYCQWVGGRLPTEAEWEKAARGTDGQKYPWGNQPVAGHLLDFCDRNCPYDWKDISADDGYAGTAPVGNYPVGASPYGAWDMAGNVWEWVADRYSDRYYQSAPAQNPPGPDTGIYRVLKGGSWYGNARNARAADRLWKDAGYVNYNVGFRCARIP